MKIGIVGGGLIGLACANELALGGHRVTVFDAAPAAREASWAAAGMLAPHHEHDTDTALYRLCRAGLDGYAAFLDRHGITAASVDLRLDGSLIPDRDDEDAAEIATKRAFLSAQGIATALLDRGDLRRQEPAFTHDLRGALLVPGGQVDPRRLSQRLRDLAQDRGVILRYGQAVAAIRDGFIRFVDGDHEGERFDQVVLASGAWTPDLARASGLDLTGEPVKGQLLRFAVADGLLRHFVHCRHAYLVPRRGAGLVVGATMVRSGFDKTEDAAAIADLADRARRLIPALDRADIVETWTGLRPRLANGLPCLARIDDRLVIATGHFRNGILLAPLTALSIAALIDGRQPPVDLHPFARASLTG